MIRLMIADDHAILRASLSHFLGLSGDMEVATEARNGIEVLERLCEGGVDLVLLDMNMPGISGEDLIARVRAQYPMLPILVLSILVSARAGIERPKPSIRRHAVLIG
jgi:DNA-binding NarL/FixJ family response regulator